MDIAFAIIMGLLFAYGIGSMFYYKKYDDDNIFIGSIKIISIGLLICGVIIGIAKALG